MRGVFVVGTDTDVGKTEISLGLMDALQRRGLTVLGMKPVAAGCAPTPEGLQNADARRLQDLGSVRVPYVEVNPYALERPIAPHIAAGHAGVEIELEVILAGAQALAARCDFLVVEGIGGWRVPLGAAFSLCDLPLALGLPVLLVVGQKLGCINHALLTAESIEGSGSQLVGWVANQVDRNMLALEENLATLGALLPVPCLGSVPWLATPEPEQIGGHLDIGRLLRELPPEHEPGPIRHV